MSDGRNFKLCLGDSSLMPSLNGIELSSISEMYSLIPLENTPIDSGALILLRNFPEFSKQSLPSASIPHSRGNV